MKNFHFDRFDGDKNCSKYSEILLPRDWVNLHKKEKSITKNKLLITIKKGQCPKLENKIANFQHFYLILIQNIN